MLILTNKATVDEVMAVNVGQACRLYVANSTEAEGYEVRAEMPTIDCLLGYYPEEQRCNEILAEVLNEYQGFYTAEGGWKQKGKRSVYAPHFAFAPPKVFYMPEE